ncbi:ABC transporter permease [Sinorhizobium alkalisoli]|uniref:Polyamine ABC transporter permease n=1 Tax=Sinorhizobium alkalisoli TaxID=1752398 RepID=A0A1E3VD33_9HYPH|nr:ABC transporter permease [Sinorhizobium alkalisoli]MCA1492294.1 ABC transporter permease [Ensifer sp. NBAIM29]MCG5479299.1 ABC transporter permease [Sinorhizobium alkalisoli]ODR91482.1 polyamine ABC transporter permease [Sinorhizobium alkalisoli]QFI66401.1 Spermidine Putrescine ABC transporter permease component potC [Sinorhizobium alkalisoli]
MFKGMKLVFAAAMVTFLIAPLIAILPLAFTSSVFLTYPIPGFSTRWFEELVTADAWQRSIVNSLIVGSGTTLLATVLGTTASLGLRHRSLPLLGVAKTLFLVPMVVPAVVLGVGMQVLFVRLGIASSYIGVIVAHTVVAIPFVVVSVTGALAGIDRRVELAAESLGAPPVTVFRRMTLPLAMPGILSGAVLAFATSLDEVVLTLFVAGPNQRTLARQMFSTIRENISPAIAAAAFIFIVGTIAIALIMLAVKQRAAASSA